MSEPTKGVTRNPDLDHVHWLLTERVVPTYHKVSIANGDGDRAEVARLLGEMDLCLRTVCEALDEALPGGCPSSGALPIIDEA